MHQITGSGIRILFFALFLCTTLGASESPLKHVSRKVNAFGAQVYEKIASTADKNENIIISPASLCQTMLMLAPGAQGETKREILSTLSLNNEDSSFIPAILKTFSLPGAQTKIHNASSLWLQQGMDVNTTYSRLLKKDYDTPVEYADFHKNPGKVRNIVNFWFHKNTGGMIKDLLRDGDITTDTNMLLANALYFQGDWLSPFDSKSTKLGKFSTPSGKVHVPMMKSSSSLPDLNYYQNKNFHAVELPFRGRRFSMVIIVPTGKNNISSCERSWVKHTGWFTGWKQIVEITMPRFKSSYRNEYQKILRTLGMETAFSKNADFSGISKNKITLRKAIQGCQLDVSENGVTAAAATAVEGSWGSEANPQKPIQFIVDRPFMFILRELKTGMVLFVGRIMTLPDEKPVKKKKEPSLSGYGPWKFGMSTREAKAQTINGPYRPNRSGGLKTLKAPWRGLNNKRAELFFDGTDRLNEIRLWLLSDGEGEKALDACLDGQAYLNKMAGTKAKLTEQIMDELEKLDKTRPQIAGADLPRKLPGVKPRLTAIRHPHYGWHVYISFKPEF